MSSENKKTPPKKDNKKKRDYSGPIFILIIIVLLVALFYMNFDKLFPKKESGIAVTVNGEVITVEELNLEYQALPDQYKALITKEVLLDQMIVSKLLIQKVKEKGIELEENELEDELSKIKQQYASEEEFNALLKEKNIEVEDLKIQLENQLLIDKLLTSEVTSKIAVEEAQIEGFYEQNKEQFEDINYEDVKDQIEQALGEDLESKSVQLYISQLKSNAEIIEGEGEPREEGPKTMTFTDTGEDVCKIGDKPIIRLFSSTKCPHCTWIKETFNQVVMGYQDRIIAHNWELDIKDDVLTDTKEDKIPSQEIEIFKKHSPKGAVPTFIFGCKYVRVGNGHENGNGLEAEEDEFREIINKLLEE